MLCTVPHCTGASGKYCPAVACKGSPLLQNCPAISDRLMLQEQEGLCAVSREQFEDCCLQSAIFLFCFGTIFMTKRNNAGTWNMDRHENVN